jgi:hypothetical protein
LSTSVLIQDRMVTGMLDMTLFRLP